VGLIDNKLTIFVIILLLQVFISTYFFKKSFKAVIEVGVMVLDKSVLKTFFTKNGVIEKTIGEIICAKIMNKI
jgi:hypothetical protein